LAYGTGTNNGRGGGTLHGCPEPYCGFASMTNGSGSIWFSAPTNSVQGTVTDTSNLNGQLGQKYLSDVVVVRHLDGAHWCGTTSVTFPVTHSSNPALSEFSFTVYIISKPCPPVGAQLSTTTQWQ
jgi:hypothetical protein